MGIPGIYKELGPGKRISLAKLSVEHLERTGRKFRLAIDISIWQFQIPACGGGRNPALRTLYFRLLKLLSLGICPLFVFDGPQKPKLKRNVQHFSDTSYPDNSLTKQLLRNFEFPFHDAPGEAEAECALLQREGIVDAVLSEDVDTLMFGCTVSLRSWSSEGSRGAKSPTHVTVYTAEANEKHAGLDRYGMVLVAIMSGGDYCTNGVNKCGPKIACEAARAGFGLDLVQLANKNMNSGWIQWRARLQHELHTNDSKFFKQKYKSINLPTDFPDQTILGYYLRPVVSSSEEIRRLAETTQWDQEFDTHKLRAFVAEAFNWPSLIDTKRFIRGLAPALLTQKLLRRQQYNNFDDHDNLEAKASAEADLIDSVHGKRTHWDTDGCVELRISYIPSNIVGVDPSEENDLNQSGDFPVLLDSNEGDPLTEEEQIHLSPLKSQKSVCAYDPHQLDKSWILETFVKLGTPLLVENWEEDMRKPKKFAARNTKERADEPSRGAMDRFVKITKPLPALTKNSTAGNSQEADVCSPSPNTTISHPSTSSQGADKKQSQNGRTRTGSKQSAAIKKIAASTSSTHTGKSKAPTVSFSAKMVNPWTLSKRPTDTYGFKSPTRYSALGIYAPNDLEDSEPRRKPVSVSTKATPTRQRRVLLDGHEAGITPRSKHGRGTSDHSDPSDGESAQILNNITYRTPHYLDRAKPSPRKRSNHVRAGQGDDSSKVPFSMGEFREETELNGLKSALDEAVTLRPTTTRVNRRLAFQEPEKVLQEQPVESRSSNNSSLPSPSILTYPKERMKEVVPISPTLERDHSKNSSLNSKAEHGEQAIVGLRESLEGAWKHLLAWQAQSTKHVFIDVEVVDLTSVEQLWDIN